VSSPQRLAGALRRPERREDNRLSPIAVRQSPWVGVDGRPTTSAPCSRRTDLFAWFNACFETADYLVTADLCAPRLGRSNQYLFFEPTPIYGVGVVGETPAATGFPYTIPFTSPADPPLTLCFGYDSEGPGRSPSGPFVRFLLRDGGLGAARRRRSTRHARIGCRDMLPDL